LRCQKCPRFPTKKSREPQGTLAVTTAPAGETSATLEHAPRSSKKKEPLTIPSRTGGPDLVRKPVRVRVRRHCHKCDAMFIGMATECNGCGHIRCKKCPRDPAKLSKYPDGYPGDAEPEIELPAREYKKPRVRIRYTCHSCSRLFMQGEKQCTQCQHEKCADCPRQPPKKIRPEADPDIIARVEEKLRQITISSS